MNCHQMKRNKYLDVVQYKTNPEIKGKISCVYFLIKDHKLVYIGKTKNLLQRIIGHKSLPRFFDSFRFIQCNDIDKYEKRLIRIFKPDMNSCLYKNLYKSKSGRKQIYRPELLKKGQILDLGPNKQFGHQYARSFNKRLPGKSFKFIDGFIKRVE